MFGFSDWQDWKCFIVAVVVILLTLAIFVVWGRAEPTDAPLPGTKGAGVSLVCNEAKDVMYIFEKYGDNEVKEGDNPIGEYNKLKGKEVCGYFPFMWEAVRKAGALTMKFGNVEVWEVKITAIDPTGVGRFAPVDPSVTMFAPFIVGGKGA